MEVPSNVLCVGIAQGVIVPARAEDFAIKISSFGVADDQFDSGFGRAIKPHDDPLAKKKRLAGAIGKMI
jgi:hypothetical protein